MRILILGGDGYLGWPTAMHFSSVGDEVMVVDNFSKRQIELNFGIEPLEPPLAVLVVALLPPEPLPPLALLPLAPEVVGVPAAPL